MPTSQWGDPTTRFQLLESITLFKTLNEVPEPPTLNVPKPEAASTYCMPLFREEEISSSLAFLAAAKNDRLQVMAVCIEEFRDKKGLTIRIASNTGVSAHVFTGFERLSRVLEQAARRGESDSNRLDH